MEQNRKIVHFQFLTYYLVGKNVGRNFYKERVEFALVPLVEDAAHFVVVHTQHVLHEVVGLADELHVSVLDAVVHHLDEVAAALLAHPVAARLVAALGADRLEDGLQVGPGGGVAAGHHGGAVPGNDL